MRVQIKKQDDGSFKMVFEAVVEGKPKQLVVQDVEKVALGSVAENVTKVFRGEPGAELPPGL
jgi:hypothetical protein